MKDNYISYKMIPLLVGMGMHCITILSQKSDTFHNHFQKYELRLNTYFSIFNEL